MRTTKRKAAAVRGMAVDKLLVKIIIGGTAMVLFISLVIPPYDCGTPAKAPMNQSASNIRQILIGLSSYASDHDGYFPGSEPDGPRYQTSTEVFQGLIPHYIDTESVFWVEGNPDKPHPPVEDGVLHPHEVSYLYVAGQTNTSFARSPLVAEEQEAPGTYGKNHPWLKKGKAIVGYIGGNVATETLTSKRPGATIRTKDGTIQDIFQPRTATPAGLLDVPRENILQPGPVKVEP